MLKADQVRGRLSHCGLMQEMQTRGSKDLRQRMQRADREDLARHGCVLKMPAKHAN